MAKEGDSPGSLLGLETRIRVENFQSKQKLECLVSEGYIYVK